MQYKDPDKKIDGRLCKIFKKKRGEKRRKKTTVTEIKSAFVLFVV